MSGYKRRIKKTEGFLEEDEGGMEEDKVVDDAAKSMWLRKVLEETGLIREGDDEKIANYIGKMLPIVQELQFSLLPDGADCELTFIPKKEVSKDDGKLMAGEDELMQDVGPDFNGLIKGFKDLAMKLESLRSKMDWHKLDPEGKEANLLAKKAGLDELNAAIFYSYHSLGAIYSESRQVTFSQDGLTFRSRREPFHP